MFKKINEINTKPKPFEYYTAAELWTNEHTAKQMLQFHLAEDMDLSSRNKDFIERSVEWIASRFKVNDSTAIADFGCGPGLYAGRLAKFGAKVTGIDFSENSLAYAKSIAIQEGLAIDYVHANYLEYETASRFDLITMIFCDYCALSPGQRKTLLAKFHTFLQPGGHVLLDVHSLNIFNKKEESATYEFNQLNGFWSPEDYYCFVNSFKYDEDKVSLDKYTIIEESRTRVVYNWLQYFDKESLQDEFVQAGFKVEEVYSDVAGTPFDPESPDFAIVARKP